MTIVFDRGEDLPDTPVTHAFVIGCGRFPARVALNRKATVAGAREIMRFLSARADDFLLAKQDSSMPAPVWTIECLLSDPNVAPGDDALGVDLGREAPANATISAAGDAVEKVTKAVVEKTGQAWLERIRPGDQAFFYMSSHGISDGSNALGLCEDVLTMKNRKWSQSLNITTLAKGLTTELVGAARGWVFFDACQEIVPSLLGRPTGLPGLHLIEFDVEQSAKASNSCAVAGSPVGGKAWAPTGDEPPFFTQALIEGLSNSCVEAVPNLGWAVTASRLMFDIPRVGDAALGRKGLQTATIGGFNQPLIGLLKIDEPMIPIALSTEVGPHMTSANVAVVCDDATINDENFTPPPGLDFVWRFRVPAHRKRSYTATATFTQPEIKYNQAVFDPDPPCQFVHLRKSA